VTLVSPTEEDLFITLASNHVRRVSTPEGAQYYGLPIGAPITADVVAKINAEKGGTPPKGALKSSKQINNGENAPSVSVGGDGSGTAPTAAGMALQVHESTLSGPHKFKVGESEYTAPSGSKLVRPKDNPDMAYILTPDGTVHAFNKDGEVDVPESLAPALVSKFSNDLTSDPNYEELSFQDDGPAKGAAALKAGDTLHDLEGNVQFIKQSDGTFKHAALGAKVDAKDIQPMIDSGGLQTKENPALDGFKDKTPEEVKAALDAAQPGEHFHVGQEDPEQVGNAHVVKNEDGSFTSTDSTGGSQASITSTQLSYLKSHLFHHESTDHTDPDAADQDAQQQVAQDAAAKQAEAEGKPLPTPAGDKDGNEPPKSTGTTAAPAEGESEPSVKVGDPYIPENDAAYPTGTVFHHNVHVKNGTHSKANGVTKQNGYFAKGDGQPYGYKVNSQFQVTGLPDAPKAEESDEPQQKDGVVGGKSAATGKPVGGPSNQEIIDNAEKMFGTDSPQHKTAKETFGPKSDKNTSTQSATVADVKQTTEAPETPDVPAPPEEKKPEDLQVGEKPTGAFAAHAALGAVVATDTGKLKWTKTAEGWTSANGFPYDDKQMDSFFSTDQYGLVIDSLGDEPVAAPKGFVPGDKVSEQDMLDAAPGTVFQYHDDMETSFTDTYTKLPTGSYMSKSGTDVPQSDFSTALKANLMEFVSAPTAEVQDEDSNDLLHGYSAGDKVTKMAHVNGFPEGTQLVTVSSGNITKGILLTKSADGWESVQQSTGASLGLSSADEVANDLSQGFLHFKSGPDMSHVQDATEEALNDTENFHVSTTPDVQIGTDTFSTKDLKDALDALESHTGFQVKYGLNGAPEGNPFKDADTRAMLTEEAQKQFPHLKPKPAVVSYLKSKLGMQEEQPEVASHVATGPMIQIGQDTPQMTQTGYDGGEFAYSDIESAITLLEASNSKLYKNELNKAGNPLGALSPNHISGFEKDKLVGKQKFLDYLKGALSKHKPSDEQHTITPEPIDPVDAMTADIEDALEAAEDIKPDGNTYVKGEDAYNLPKGTVGINAVGTKVTKTSEAGEADEDNWVSESGDDYTFDSGTTGVHVLELPKEPDIVPDEDAWEFPEDGSTWGLTDLQDAPVGTSIKLSGALSQSIYTKSAPDVWTNPVYPSSKLSDADLSGYKFNKPEQSVPVDMEDAGTSLTMPEKFTIGQSTKGMVNDLPSGSVIKAPSGIELIKGADGSWTNKNSGVAFSTSVLDSTNMTLVSFPNEHVKQDVPVSADDLDGLPIGSVVEAHYQAFASDFFTKVSPDTWKDEHGDEFDQVVITNHMDQGGTYTLDSKPQGEPEYAHTPDAVQDKNHNGFDLPKDEDVLDAEIGSVFKDTSNNNVAYWTKTDTDDWSGVSGQGDVISASSNTAIIKRANAGELDWPSEQGPDYNKSGLMPGKYLGSGKAYMIVKADGKGVYVNSKGKVTNLSANAVKKNHDAGMNLYGGMPDTIPAVGDLVGDVSKSSTAKKASALEDKVLPDGTYFSAHPDLNKKATVYAVEGDKVTVHKPATSVLGSNAKVNGNADKTWTQNATEGAKFNFYLYLSTPSKKHGGQYEFTKKNGVWEDESGSTKPENTEGDQFSSWQDFFDQYSPYQWYNSSIEFHGQQEPVETTQKKIQTQIKKGQVVDQHGMSIVPDGYSGNVQWFGSEASVVSLVSAQKAMGDSPSKQTVIDAVKNSGLTMPTAGPVKKYIEANGWEWNDENKWKALKKTIDDSLVGLDTEVPTADTSKYFTYDEFGAMTPPAVMSNDYAAYNSPSMTAYIKAQAAEFGGGGIIGQHAAQMDKWDKSNWIDAYKAGNFALMYTYEQQAAASKNKVHASGYLHPGFPDNTETHQVAWGAAVPGEVSALADVPGAWSPLGVTAPMEEVDNYLIKAQMQNPTFLTASEKRQWVTNHRQNNKAMVDLLSTTAMQRKTSGHATLSPEVSWTDEVTPAKSYDHKFEDTKFPVNFTDAEAKDWAADFMVGTGFIPEGEKNEKFFEDQPEGTSFWAGIYSPFVKTNGKWKDKDGDFVNTYEMAGKAKAYGLANATAEVPEGSEQAEFLENFKSAIASSTYHNTFANSVNSWFQKQKDVEDAKALIPVYKIAANQTVAKGTQQIFDVTDQFGNKFFFKPRPDTQMDNYRTEAEHAGNVMGRLLGFDTAKSKIVTIDGQRGQLQSDVGGVGNLMGADYGTLTAKQLADIANEHVLDWFLDNDDAKGDNVKVMSNGHVVGIDKGRAWKHFGAWNGLSGDENMNTNASTIYAQMFSAIRSGKISKEDADFAYLAMQKKINRIQKVSDAKVSEVLADGMKNRPSFEVSYSIDGKKVPQSLSGLTAAMLDRKSHLGEDFENLWKGIYSDAGYGDLPEPPANELGEIVNGLEDANLPAEVLKAKATGKAAMVAGAHVIGGNVLTWMDEYQDGTQNVSGQFYLGPKAQDQMLDFLVKNATDVAPSHSSTLGFSQYDTYGDTFLQAAKTINHHSEDGQYNMDKVNPFLSAVKDIDTELEQWSPMLQPNTKVSGEDAFKFSTGKTVPMTHVDQYKLMLDAYKEKAVPIQAGYDKKTKTGVFSQFDAVSISPSKPKYVTSEGDILQPLAKGYLHKDSVSGTVKMVSDADANETVALFSDKWNAVDETNSEKSGAGVKITKRNYTHEKKATFKDFKKITKKEHDGHSVDGSSGQEYEIELPTGEKIYYRNGGNTGTALGQQGRVTFRADGTSDETAVSAALSNVLSQLEAMGFNLNASNHSDAELTYWREMYGILANRNHTMSGATGAKYAAAEKDMWAKQKEIGGNKNHFLETLDEKMTPDEQVTFWRDLWAKHFGQDKVDDLIASEGYLPKFDHQDYTQPDLETGMPYWERFDFSAKEIQDTGKLLMSTTGGGASVWADRFKSGGLISGEERLRQLDEFVSGGYGSAGQDQQNGSSHYVYTRIMSESSASDGYDVIFSPALMRRTRSYSFASDNWGKLANRKKSAPSDILHSIDSFGGMGGNETMIPNTTTLLDALEVMIFDSTSARDKAIQDLKKAGLEQIRGLPIEDRLVMRENVQAAIQKVKEAWSKTYE
jgi:hypothetical protein